MMEQVVTLKADVGTLRSEMRQVRTELKGDVADLRTEMKGAVADLRTELRAAERDLRQEIHDVRNWLFGLMFLAIIGLLARLLIPGAQRPERQ